MESVSTKCVHPFFQVQSEHSDYHNEITCLAFQWCTKCEKVLVWCPDDKVIPNDWRPKLRKLAKKLTGYPFEQLRNTEIRIPSNPSEVDGSLSMLKTTYAQHMLVDYQNKINWYSKAYGGKKKK